ncbi:prolyl aminopeptidase [Leifsonia sp. P73]|uniref:prolyl aminopeptidase n=1 Tax=Leifsonia sp. P73 TaxID=3423959 RepID=UPI003DA1CBFB
MRTLYPEIEPYDSGMLDVGDGQQVYFETSGNPDGKPVVFLHGGPGGGSTPSHRRLFDPERYRIVLLDQRNCGRSLPHASDPDADLSANTTWNLVSDLEKLREHLEIERWQVFGGSWGSALALAYAETHPERVTELIVRGIFTLRPAELDWFYEGGAAALFPDLWEGFVEPVPPAERGHLIRAYSRLLADEDPAVHGPAAIAWSRWESSTITLLPRPEVVETFTEEKYAVAFARIENHYFMNGGWFEEDQLIRDAYKLEGIPGVIVQGRYDVCTPAMTAWDLHRAWPEAELNIVADAGHAYDEPGILDALIEATDRFAAEEDTADDSEQRAEADAEESADDEAEESADDEAEESADDEAEVGSEE